VLALADAIIDILRAILPGKPASASASAKQNDKTCNGNLRENRLIENLN